MKGEIGMQTCKVATDGDGNATSKTEDEPAAVAGAPYVPEKEPALAIENILGSPALQLGAIYFVVQVHQCYLLR